MKLHLPGSSIQQRPCQCLLLVGSQHQLLCLPPLSTFRDRRPLRRIGPAFRSSLRARRTRRHWSLLAVGCLFGAIWSFRGPFWASSFYKRSVTRAHAQRAQTRPQLGRSRQQGRMGPLPPLPRLLVGTVPSGSNESIDSALWTRSYGFRHHKSLCNTSAARKKCVNSQADTTRRGRAWPCTVSDCCVATHDEFDERRRDGQIRRYIETCI